MNLVENFIDKHFVSKIKKNYLLGLKNDRFERNIFFSISLKCGLEIIFSLSSSKCSLYFFSLSSIDFSNRH